MARVLGYGGLGNTNGLRDFSGKAEAEEEDDMPDASDLPWKKIKTRFDAAREFLKLSLRTLTPDKSFCVIFFGSQAELMKTTPGLMPATKANIDKCIRELDRIKGGPGSKDRPDGLLRGNTNLHGGMHRAFKVRNRGLSKNREYVDPDTFIQGADTIFLLSDGKPTWDDWPIVDKRDPYDNTGDPESNVRHPDQPNLKFPGPYGYFYTPWLVDDIRRLNLFRKCEIHCVGIGEADSGLISEIARIGMGMTRFVGGS